MNQYTVYIAVGSNIGDKAANCQNGIDALIDSTGAVLVNQSRFYKTEPVGYEDQDWFINGVFCIRTGLEPQALLEKTQAVQTKAGRKASVIRNGPRILDLDILLFDDRIINSRHLSVPHPRMHERRFVLQPFCDISPDVVHPILKKDMKTLLAALPDNTQQVVES